jgi:hypothetical protein
VPQRRAAFEQACAPCACRARRLQGAASPPLPHPGRLPSPPSPQVFEYLTTDLKRYMDRNGKGPAYPLPTQTVKVWG